MSARRRRPSTHPTFNEAPSVESPQRASPAVEEPEPQIGRMAKLLDNWRTIASAFIAVALLAAGIVTWSNGLVRRPELEQEHRYAAGIGTRLDGVEQRVTKVESDQAETKDDLKWIKTAVWELLRPTGKVVPPPP